MSRAIERAAHAMVVATAEHCGDDIADINAENATKGAVPTARAAILAFLDEGDESVRDLAQRIAHVTERPAYQTSARLIARTAIAALRALAEGKE